MNKNPMKLQNLCTFNAYVGNALCTVNKKKCRQAGRPSSETPPHLQRKRCKGPKKTIPTKESRLDGLQHLLLFGEKHRRELSPEDFQQM